MKKNAFFSVFMMVFLITIQAIPVRSSNNGSGFYQGNLPESIEKDKKSNSSTIVRGERPVIDVATVPAKAMEQTIIRIKFSEKVENYLDHAQITNNPDGSIRFGIEAVDKLNQQFGVFQVKKTFAAALQNTKFTTRHRLWGFHLWYDLIVPSGTDIREMVLAYGAKSEIQISEPVYRKQQVTSEITELVPAAPLSANAGKSFTPSDPYFNNQWHYHNTGQQNGTPDADIDLPEAWDIEKGNSDVIVAVIDEGIDYLHPDLAGNMWPGIGYNFAVNSTGVTPMNHGTHVAGTIAANSNNGLFVSGIAGGTGVGDGVRLMSCQVYASTTWGGWETAPIWAADNDAAISQNSWGYSDPGVVEQAMLDAIDYFNANGGGTVLNGGLTIFSAGNSGTAGQFYPGCYSGAFSVAATNNQDKKAWYSNYDTWVDLSAPGGETNTVFERGVLSCLADNGYGYLQGTSMACPHVSGVAALIISHAPGLFNPQQVRDILTSTTDNIDGLNPTYAGYMGTGRLNAHKALLLTQEYIMPIARFSATPTMLCTGGTVTFTDATITTPASWIWNFPGGTPSTYSGQYPPAVTYSMAGIYDVSLTVSDGTTSNTETKSAYITVKDVIADFSASTTSVYIGNTIAFTDASTCGPAMWQWTFTGGTPSSFTGQTPPPIEYATLGTYEVSLTVTKPGATDTKISSIQVTPALFNMSNQSVTSCSGQFFDSGGESGTYSSAQNLTKTFYPSTPGAMIRLTFTSFSTESGYDYLYVYNGPDVNAPLIGTYEGTNSPGIVSANNTSGALTFRFISDGSVVAAGWAATLSCYTIVEPPVTDFAASSITLPVNSSIGFIDLSVNAPTSWNWAFSPDNAVFIDGTTANSQNPHVAFTAQGIYTVSLTATNANGSDTETKADYITVGPNAYNMADGSITTCEGVFYDSGGLSGNYNYEENVTETFYPSTPGAMLMFAFTSFETENFTDTLFIYDGSDITAPLIGAYNGSVGPGTISASNPAGSLTFRFVALGGGGGPAGMGSGWVANISCYDPAALPVADFIASATTAQQNSPITFYDQSLNMPNAWAWSFNPADVMYINGTDENSQNPQVQFSSTGQYTVSLTATNINGSNTVTKTNFITITQPDYCIPTYTYGSTDGDYITLVQLEDIDNWTGASENPYYTYYNTLSTNLMAGSEYTITLIAGTFEDSNIISVWIDYNQNGIFESLEKLGTVELLASPDIGNITFTVPIDANVGMTRMRVREVFDEADLDPCIEYGYGETEDYNINITNTARYLSLTLFLEGLFDGTSMNKAQNGVGDQFTGTIADEITVELRNHLAPYELAAVPYTVGVNTDGTASVNIPEALNGNYYIVVQHRNSIETWSGSPVSFSGEAILYDFTTDASQAYGDNMKLISGKYVIFSGDINLDGAVDGLDMIPLDNEAANFGSGYIPEDINGDSSIDALDMIILDNNSAQFISKITP